MSLQVLGCGSTLPRLPWHAHTEHDALHMRNRIGLECKRMIAWHELFLDIRLVSKVWRMKDTVAMSTWLRRLVASTVTPQMTMIGTQQVTQHDCVDRNGLPLIPMHTRHSGMVFHISRDQLGPPQSGSQWEEPFHFGGNRCDIHFRWYRWYSQQVMFTWRNPVTVFLTA